MKRLFIITHPVRNYVYENLARFAAEMAIVGIPAVSPLNNRLSHTVARIIKKSRLGRNFFDSGEKAYIASVEWASDTELIPVGLTAEIIPYCIDCWPGQYEEWESIFRRYKTRTAFFSARASMAYFTKQIPELECHWLPEAIDSALCRPSQPLEKRNIHVMELGRSYPPCHQAIQELAKKGKLKYITQDKGKRNFESNSELWEALANTQIYVCFPKTMTHPQEAMGVETMTLRYLEGIASGCIIVGHCPVELSDLFGYNPVVEFDERNPANQLALIAENITQYAEFAQKNLSQLYNVGTWSYRVGELLSKLKQTRRYTVS